MENETKLSFSTSKDFPSRRNVFCHVLKNVVLEKQANWITWYFGDISGISAKDISRFGPDALPIAPMLIINIRPSFELSKLVVTAQIPSFWNIHTVDQPK